MAGEAPLTGLRVLELGGLAPGPFCGLLLADWGASVLRIDRPSVSTDSDLLVLGKSSIALDLKDPTSLEIILSLVPKGDVLIDPFRPGALERLGLDPVNVLLKMNPRLIVTRLTGFRRDGKYSQMAGHDINYLAASGVLSMLGRKGEPPYAPSNLLGDFAGGGHAAFTGILLALLHRQISGQGQVVNANMVDGASYLATSIRLLQKNPIGDSERGTNTYDGGAPYYDCYECKDADRYMSVAAIEPQFWTAFLEALNLSETDVVPGALDRLDKRSWPYMRTIFQRKVRSKTRAEWELIFDGKDACCVPVLERSELEKAGYEHRPIVGLSRSPAREVSTGWDAKPLLSGEGVEAMLKCWAGWTRGRDYVVSAQRTFHKQERSKL